MVAASSSIPLHANFVANGIATRKHHAAMAFCVMVVMEQLWPAQSSAFLVPYVAKT